jgi:hypothetical protein
MSPARPHLYVFLSYSGAQITFYKKLEEQSEDHLMSEFEVIKVEHFLT